MYYGANRLRTNSKLDPAIVWTKTEEGSISPIVVETLKTWIHRAPQDMFWNAEAQALIKVAQRAIEQRCYLALAPTTWVGTAPDFPVKIIRRPFLEVSAVAYVNEVTGEITTLPTDQYVAASDLQLCGQILPPRGVDWPNSAERSDGVRITVKTSFGDTLPEDILHAIMMTVAALDSNRGDNGGGGSRLDNTVWGQTNGSGASIIPKGAMALLSPYMYRSHVAV